MPDNPDGLPDGFRLRLLELQSRHEGSGLNRDDLIGLWRLERIWAKGGVTAAGAAGAALRALAASLRIRAGEGASLQLVNSVAIGSLTLRFTGPGTLRARRPLLVFQFERVHLCWADRTLWTRTLPPAPPGREPFFALIASGAGRPQSRWLAARGRGGGLALWVREENEAP